MTSPFASSPFFVDVDASWASKAGELGEGLAEDFAEDDAAARDRAAEIANQLGESGLARAAIESSPDQLRACCAIRERLAYSSPLADAVFALQALGTRALLIANGSGHSDWIEGVASGQAIAAFAMTEPEAGSDVSSLGTTAAADGDDYLVNGRKTFISNAGIADFYTTFARTGTRDDGRAEISCLLIPADTPGCTFVEAQILAEPHPLGTIEFQDCRVPRTQLVGEVGEGFRLGMQTLDLLRPTVAAAACGMAARALDEASTHARARQQFGKPLAQFQLIQAKLADMATELEAARLLVARAAWMADTKAANTLASAQAKLFATEAAQRIVDDAVQILGGSGVLVGNPVERLYRAVRALRIYEGTSEIQRLIISQHVLEIV